MIIHYGYDLKSENPCTASAQVTICDKYQISMSTMNATRNIEEVTCMDCLHEIIRLFREGDYGEIHEKLGIIHFGYYVPTTSPFAKRNGPYSFCDSEVVPEEHMSTNPYMVTCLRCKKEIHKRLEYSKEVK